MLELSNVGMHDRVLKRLFFQGALLPVVIKQLSSACVFNSVLRTSLPFLSAASVADILAQHASRCRPRAYSNSLVC